MSEHLNFGSNAFCHRHELQSRILFFFLPGVHFSSSFFLFDNEGAFAHTSLAVNLLRDLNLTSFLKKNISSIHLAFYFIPHDSPSSILLFWFHLRATHWRQTSNHVLKVKNLRIEINRQLVGIILYLVKFPLLHAN